MHTFPAVSIFNNTTIGKMQFCLAEDVCLTPGCVLAGMCKLMFDD